MYDVDLRVIIALIFTGILIGLFIPFPYTVGVMVYGNSMEPAMCTGDVVVIDTGSHIEVGDIIVFKDEYYVIAHRVRAVHDNYYMTRGDNRSTADGFTKRENVIGEVSTIISPRDCGNVSQSPDELSRDNRQAVPRV